MEDLEKMKETFEKKNKIMKLVDDIHYPVLLEYFDFESDKNLDRKISVLQQMKQGMSIDEIDGFWDILELYPKDGTVI